MMDVTEVTLPQRRVIKTGRRLGRGMGVAKVTVPLRWDSKNGGGGSLCKGKGWGRGYRRSLSSPEKGYKNGRAPGKGEGCRQLTPSREGVYKTGGGGRARGNNFNIQKSISRKILEISI